VDEVESRWLESPRSTPKPPENIDPGNAAEGIGELGPEGTQWAQSLLDVARFELARADDKANTLFRFYGVVAALSIGLLAGSTASPTNLVVGAQVIFWAGCAAFLASGVYLGMTLYPRDIRKLPQERLLYFGHVVQYQSVDELTEGLRGIKEDSESRLVEQLLSVSRLVHTKYALTRKALIALAVGAFLCLSAVVLNVVVTQI
jgi:hypothetical protein